MKPKLPKPAKTFDVPMYLTTIVLITNPADYDLWCARYGDGESNPYGSGGMCYTGFKYPKEKAGHTVLIGVFHHDKSILLHELAHATFDILGHVGIPVEPNQANEAFCYLIQYLYKQCEGFIK